VSPSRIVSTQYLLVAASIYCDELELYCIQYVCDATNT